MRCQCRKSRAHPCIAARYHGKPVIVMGFSEMHRSANGVIQLPTPLKMIVNLVRRRFLKEFRIDEIDPCFIENPRVHLPAPAQPLKEKDSGRILESHFGDYVSPDFDWNHVPGITTKPIHSQTTPENKDVGQVTPEIPILKVELDQVIPGYAPRPG